MKVGVPLISLEELEISTSSHALALHSASVPCRRVLLFFHLRLCSSISSVIIAIIIFLIVVVTSIDVGLPFGCPTVNHQVHAKVQGGLVSPKESLCRL